MNIGDAFFYGLSLALMMVSWRFARVGKPALAIILGVMAWSALFLPRMLLWPNPDKTNVEWFWLLVGALGFICVPAIIFMQTKRRR